MLEEQQAGIAWAQYASVTVAWPVRRVSSSLDVHTVSAHPSTTAFACVLPTHRTDATASPVTLVACQPMARRRWASIDCAAAASPLEPTQRAVGIYSMSCAHPTQMTSRAARPMLDA